MNDFFYLKYKYAPAKQFLLKSIRHTASVLGNALESLAIERAPRMLSIAIES